VCKSKKFSKLFSLGNLYISTFVEEKKENIGKAPLELIYCDNCTLVQLKHNVSQELMYSGNYWYQSHLNPVIVKDLKDIVEKAIKYQKEGLWIDIGANDGTLLGFVPKSFHRLGVEPAKNLTKELSKNCDGYFVKFWEEINYQDTLAKVITAIGMFYDSPDPNIFIANVKKHLADDGLFIAQLESAKTVLKENDVSNICNEHLEYYSYKSLKYLFENNGLEIFKVEENEINGGSYRLYARHFKVGSINYPEDITKKSFIDFYKRVQKNKENCLMFIKKLKRQKKIICGYGASTRGNTILQWYKLNKKHITAIAEIHPDKINKLTVGTEIPIIKEEHAKEFCDYFLVLPFGFRDYFLNKNQDFINKGGRFIFTTPVFQVWPNK